MATDVPPLDSVDAHYQQAAWVTTTSPDDPPNDRSTDDTEAALGAAALKDRTAEALGQVRGLLAAGVARDVILIPWQGWSKAGPCAEATSCSPACWRSWYTPMISRLASTSPRPNFQPRYLYQCAICW